MFIYCLTNKINGKKYFGKVQKKGKTLEQRVEEHVILSRKSRKFALHNAILKYGIENFTAEIKCTCRSEYALNKMECFYIAKYKTNRYKFGEEFGYNLTIGGDGRSDFQATQETKDKLSKSLKGRKFTQEHKDKIRQRTLQQHADKEKKAKLVSGIRKSFENEELLKKMSEKAKLQWSEDRDKMVTACFSQEVRAKRRKTHKRLWTERKVDD